MKNAVMILMAIGSLCLFSGTTAATSGGGNDAGAQKKKDPILVHGGRRSYSEHFTQFAGARNMTVDFSETPEHMPSRERMVKEVVLLWDLWFDDNGASDEDPRRSKFTQLAEYIVTAVTMYQTNPTDIGGKLPGHRNDHLYIAYTAAKESSITPDLKSKSNLGEVCLMQLHGQALAGYPPEKVRKNPKLCILLGTRWLASRIPACMNGRGEKAYGNEYGWDDSDWVGPLSFYAGGHKALKKGGGCKRFSQMEVRVDAVRFYRSRIDTLMEHWEG